MNQSDNTSTEDQKPYIEFSSRVQHQILIDASQALRKLAQDMTDDLVKEIQSKANNINSILRTQNKLLETLGIELDNCSDKDEDSLESTPLTKGD